ncbi:MAG: hypothetical protein ACON5B_11775 [Myxococcota bacterium]
MRPIFSGSRHPYRAPSVVVDLITTGTLFAGTTPVMAWARAALPTAIGITITLQVIALALCTWSVARKPATVADLTHEVGWLDLVHTLSTLLAAGGIVWVALAWLSVDDGNSADRLAYWIHLAIGLFGGVLAIGVVPELVAETDTPSPWWQTALTTATVSAFVICAEATLLACLESGGMSLSMLFVATLVSYLPVRVCLSLAADTTIAGLVSGTTAWALFYMEASHHV